MSEAKVDHRLQDAFDLLVRAYRSINKEAHEDGESWDAVSPDVHWFISDLSGDTDWLQGGAPTIADRLK